MSVRVSISAIDPNPFQPRTHFDDVALRELADDIRRNGLLQPALGRLVKRDGTPVETEGLFLDSHVEIARLIGEGYRIQLAAGERRFRAFKLLDEEGAAPDWPEDLFATARAFDKMDVVLQPFDDERMATLAWAENAARKEITPMEEAEYFARLNRPAADGGFGWTHAQIGEHLGVNRTVITNRLRLLQLPDDLRAGVSSGDVPVGKALALLQVEQLPAEVQAEVRESWSAGEKLEKHEEYTAEEIRRGVKRAVGYASEDLEGAPFPTDEAISLLLLNAEGKVALVEEEEHVRQPTCEGCPLRFSAPVEKGSADRCGDGECYGAKKRIWKRCELEVYTAEHGFEIVDTSKEGPLRGYGATEYFDTNAKYYPEKASALKAALGKEGEPAEPNEHGRCENLKLDVGSTYNAGPRGVPASYCCTRQGKDGKANCLCLSRLQRATKKEKNDAEEAVARIEENVTRQTAAALGGTPAIALRIIVERGHKHQLEDLEGESIGALVDAAAVTVLPRASWDARADAKKRSAELKEWGEAIGLKLDVEDPGEGAFDEEPPSPADVVSANTSAESEPEEDTFVGVA